MSLYDKDHLRKDAEIIRLRDAIRRHRDMSGDDRCRLDDIELYKALGEPMPDAPLPPECDFIESCRRYWRQRRTPSARWEGWPRGMTIGQLENELKGRAQEMSETDQILGKALHDPPYYPDVSPVDDGSVFTGEGILSEVAERAAKRIAELESEVAAFKARDAIIRRLEEAMRLEEAESRCEWFESGP